MLGRKLKSRRGMSILMGLLLLFVCATAGAAALTAAASNAGRYTHMHRDQQRYLAVSSAAKLVRDKLCAGEYTASASLTETYERYTTKNPETGAVTWHTRGPFYGFNEGETSDYSGAFAPWLKDQLEELFQANEVPGDWWSKDGRAQPASPGKLEYSGLGVQVDGEDSAVQWRLELGEDYRIVATFWFEEEDGNKYYTTTLTIPAAAVSSSDAATDNTRYQLQTTSTQTLTVTWPAQGAVIRQS